MAISIHSLFILLICTAAVLALGARVSLNRRLRRPQLAQGVIAGAASILVPANVYCAVVVGPETSRHGALGLCVVLTSLIALCGIAILVLRLRIARQPARVPRRVLAIGAHPDDLELGCGGTLAKLADSGHEVRGLVMTQGSQGGDCSVRPSEARRGGRFLGAADLEVLDLPDTRLAEHGMEVVQAIEREIYRFNPDIIFTHSSNDQHQDHLAVHLATLRAARQHSSILCYESPSATPAFEPRVFVDIQDYVNVKIAALGTHRDQKDKPYMSPERIHGLAVYRGSQAKIRHAEGYEPARLLGSAVGAI
jgi:LmbE family N-acetylglucosaminyl deacetylase